MSQPRTSRELAAARAVHHFEPEARVIEAALQVHEGTLREVIDADDLDALGEQPIAEVRSDEAGRSGDSDFLQGVLLTTSSSVRDSGRRRGAS